MGTQTQFDFSRPVEPNYPPGHNKTVINQTTKVYFSGSDIDAKLDNQRLSLQIVQIFNLMKDGAYRTLTEIAQATKYSEASISAQLRNLRKTIYGGHKISKRRTGRPNRGLFEYKLTINTAPQT